MSFHLLRFASYVRVGILPAKALAKRTRKSTQFSTCVQLAFRLVTHLRRLAIPNCVDFGRAQFLYVSRRKFFTVLPPNASRHKLIASQLYIREMYGFLQFAWTCEPTCESVWPPIVSPCASSGLANLCRLANQFGQGRKNDCILKETAHLGNSLWEIAQAK